MKRLLGFLGVIFLSTSLFGATITIDVDDKDIIKLKQDKKQKGATVTLVNFVIDESQSMTGKEGFIVEEFNKYLTNIQDNKNSKCNKFVTIMMFTTEEYRGDSDNRFNIIKDNEPLKQIKPLILEDYSPANWTPLYDAVAFSVQNIDKEVKRLTGEGEKVAVLNIIMSDGYENASKEHNQQTIAEVISKKEKEGYTFVYIGANQDSYRIGQDMGFKRGNIQNWTANSAGINQIMDVVSCDTSAYFTNVDGGNYIQTDSFFTNDLLND